MSTPLLSVITPSYNQAEFIEDNLRSVRGLNGAIEHIVVDGDSDDETVSILREYENEYNLRWVSEPDDGQSHAVNKGLEMANGEYVGWLNADDYYLSGANKLLNATKDQSDAIDVFYGDFVFVDIDGQELSKKYHANPSQFVHKYWQNYTANHCSFIRRSVFKELGGLREDLEYVMDVELLWRILEEDYEQRHVPHFIAARRIHDDAKTVGESTHKNEQEKELLRDMYGYSLIDRFVPRKALTLLAICLQTILFASQSRWEAIENVVDTLKSR
ncbi:MULTISPECIES: glycosyltransferase family 2 protein [Haloarcula]|uniref:glycosyltransferase family 2 protein n=1 Tax=Haloarcula TaxID=2237 RepID=UPI0023EC8F75|nr:glycosyltransferase family 2 protein [Halomicroarcula sp. XH51]